MMYPLGVVIFMVSIDCSAGRSLRYIWKSGKSGPQMTPACHSTAAQALEVLFAARLAPGNAGGALRVETGRFRFAQHPPHLAAHLPGQLALGQFVRAQFVVRAMVAAEAAPAHLNAGVAAVPPAPHLAARLRVLRPVSVMAVAAAALAAHLNAAVTAVPPEPHLAARLRVKRTPTVRPSAAPFMNDNRYLGQNLHLKCMVARVSTWPGDTAPAASISLLPANALCVLVLKGILTDAQYIFNTLEAII
jgi:hypothetical protein